MTTSHTAYTIARSLGVWHTCWCMYCYTFHASLTCRVSVMPSLWTVRLL